MRMKETMVAIFYETLEQLGQRIDCPGTVPDNLETRARLTHERAPARRITSAIRPTSDSVMAENVGKLSPVAESSSVMGSSSWRDSDSRRNGGSRCRGMKNGRL